MGSSELTLFLASALLGQYITRDSIPGAVIGNAFIGSEIHYFAKTADHDQNQNFDKKFIMFDRDLHLLYMD